MMSVFLEKAPQAGDSSVCREYYWAKSLEAPLKRDSIKEYEIGDKAVVEHMVV